jgi:hypothetical protein
MSKFNKGIQMSDKIPRHKNPVQETFRISMEQMAYLVKKHFGRNQFPFLLEFVETCNENEEQFEYSK